ncbi:DUF397 domain-containing protein [Streptomyces sp. NPDC094437]|uniref:DUF397 domain-containing protein n=1 Tax=Streptomyces sp. NPDC094437 TaxID=3366060 RepID=UPI00380FF29D
MTGVQQTSAGGAAQLAWFKSSYSSGNDGETCVEVAVVPGAVHVRDSKDVGGPRFVVGAVAWGGFLRLVG